ncbi:MAG: sigma-70 family RNA polymerase sigma factor [Phycisphaerales bacterium]
MAIDREINIAGCIAGHKAAWDAFVRATAGVVHAAVRRAITRRGASATETDDRVQEVYMRLLQRDAHLLRTFDPSKASLSTWLHIIARTVVHEHARRREIRRADVDTSEMCAAAPTNRSTPELPWAALSEQQRAVLQLLFDAQLSVEQVAARLGISPQTVRSAKHKGLERLRAELGHRRDGRIDGDARPRERIHEEGDSDATSSVTNVP